MEARTNPRLHRRWSVCVSYANPRPYLTEDEWSAAAGRRGSKSELDSEGRFVILQRGRR